LADGASLLLTVAATSDRNGQVFAGPVPPDEPVDSTTAASGDAVLATAVRWLSARGSCP
jgi:hypothetical protein